MFGALEFETAHMRLMFSTLEYETEHMRVMIGTLEFETANRAMQEHPTVVN